MVTASHTLDRVLVLEMVRVTEAAAVAASKLIGRGDEKAADAAAVEAMRAALNTLDMEGTVVIGEGERDEAPMLFIGEKVGSAQGGPRIDIALDPLEGTTITAKAGPNALAVLAIAEEGCLLNAPDVYMDKLAVGPGYPEGVIDIRKSPTENIKAVAAAKGVAPSDIIVCVLDRPRHEKLIAELRSLGCGIMLIPDGDVAGVIATTNPTPRSTFTWVRAERRRACWRRRRCAASAASSRGGSCSATTTSVPAPPNGASRTSIASII
jgi:fructose-1,6-bisphosphatase II / sedoheptulose-1,7-bisphosphatase